MRFIIVPQYPAKMRYQEWWISEFEKEYQKYFDEVIVLGKNFSNQENTTSYHKNFSPLETSVNFELAQIKEYLNMKLYQSDILFLCDLSYPGIFPSILYHKKPKKCFSFCHGTSRNKYDYYVKNRRSKWKVEDGIHFLFNKVFVATRYHQKKLGWKNTEIVGVPSPPLQGYKLDKKYDLISVSRDCIQKRNHKVELFVESEFGKIQHPKNLKTWEEYYKFISQAKIMLITSKEETFGYQVIDAVLNNCIPIAPNDLSFPELLPSEFLYKVNVNKDLINYFQKYDDLHYRIASMLDHPQNPTLLNQELIDNFYENTTRIMKNE